MYKLAFLIFILVFLSWCFEWKNMNNNIESLEKIVKDNNYEEKIIKWDSMEPLLKNGSRVFFDKKAYKSLWDIEKDDLILYDFKWDKNPIIKRIVAKDTSIVSIENNSIFVDWKEIKNSIWESYNFSINEQKVMKMYIDKNWNIPKKSFFILWDNTKNSIDSRKFWAVSFNDIFWKVIIEPPIQN